MIISLLDNPACLLSPRLDPLSSLSGPMSAMLG